MSDTDDGIEHTAAAPPLPPRHRADPWPHEHGEHPSGISVPDGGLPAHHEHSARLIGAPEPVRRARRGVPPLLVVLVLLALVVGAAAVVVTMA